MSIFDLPLLVNKLSERYRRLWSRIYAYSDLCGRLELVSELNGWSKAEVEKQQIMRITNLVTGEGALFNHLRGKRPQAYRRDQSLDSLVEEYQEDCPFCSPELRTPRDPFGRVRGKYCLTASNLTKYDEYHGLVIPVEHHPLEFNRERVEDYFRAAAGWFDEVRSYDTNKNNKNEVLYPFLMWNCLWPAGSSVVHGHLQMTVTKGVHYPKVDHFLRCSLRYFKEYNSDYFQDLFELHRALGLGWRTGIFNILLPLTPVKEKEIYVILAPGSVTPQRLGSMGGKVGEILNLLKAETGLNSFNAAVYLPPLGRETEQTGIWSNFPWIARLVDRGSVFNRTADIGAMELFAAGVISSDPFEIAALLKEKDNG